MKFPRIAPVAFAAALLALPRIAARAAIPHRRHADDTAEHRAHAGAHRQRSRAVQEGRSQRSR